MKKLGFGLMRLPLTNPADPKSIDMPFLMKMADEFIAHGFTYFDTAYIYHYGESENAFRKAVAERYPRDSYTIATKLRMLMLETGQQQEAMFEEQLEKCGVDYFDYYLLHAIDSEMYAVAEKLDSFGFLTEKKKAGKIRYAGFSYHDNAELLDEILTKHPEVDFVQIQINYLDWNDKNIQSKKCWETIRKHGKNVVVMEPVKGGTLARVPEKVENLFRGIDPEMSAASWAVRFAAGLDGVTTVLSGMSDMEQLRDNIGYMEDFRPLGEAEKEAVVKAAEIIHASVAIPCTGCRYCTDGCPKNIPIPEYFALYNADVLALNKGFSTQTAYYDNFARKFGKAGDCIDCGQCERMCPQHLKVPELMKLVAERLEDKN